ncbi:MAG: ABC transporter permease [Oceanicaulis sp.]
MTNIRMAAWGVASRPRQSMMMVLTLAAGVAAVSLAAAILNGYGRAMEQMAFGAYVRSLAITENFANRDRFGPPRLSDLDDLEEALADRVEAVAAWRTDVVEARFGAAALELGLHGVQGAYRYEADMALAAGRLLEPEDLISANRRCLLGAEAAQRLFERRPSTEAVGDSVRINGVACEIVGVFQPAVTLTASQYDLAILTPFMAAARYFQQDSRLSPNEASRLTVVLRSRELVEEATVIADRVMRAEHGAPLSQRAPFRYTDQSAPLGAMARQRTMLQSLLGAVAAITLAASVIGYAGNMFAAVTLRRRDIALQMAGGAYAGDILRQHLLESAALGIAGALIGAGTAAVLAAFAEALFSLPAVFDLHVASVALAVGVGAGLFAGAAPAWRAAQASPAVAMKA